MKKTKILLLTLLSILLFCACSSKKGASNVSENISQTASEISKEITAEGKIITTLSNGTIIEKSNDGTTIETASDGTTKEIQVDGTIIKTATDGTITETKVDGTVILSKTDGYKIETAPDGSTREIKVPTEVPTEAPTQALTEAPTQASTPIVVETPTQAPVVVPEPAPVPSVKVTDASALINTGWTNLTNCQLAEGDNLLVGEWTYLGAIKGFFAYAPNFDPMDAQRLITWAKAKGMGSLMRVSTPYHNPNGGFGFYYFTEDKLGLDLTGTDPGKWQGNGYAPSWTQINAVGHSASNGKPDVDFLMATYK